MNISARERIGHQNLSQKVTSKKGSLGVIFYPRNYRANAHSKSANFEEDPLGATCSAGPFCLLPKYAAGQQENTCKEKQAIQMTLLGYLDDGQEPNWNQKPEPSEPVLEEPGKSTLWTNTGQD